MTREEQHARLDDAEPDPDRVTALLDGIPDAFEQLAVAEGQVARGEVVDLDEL